MKTAKMVALGLFGIAAALVVLPLALVERALGFVTDPGARLLYWLLDELERMGASHD